jgi:hypothetical protein
LNNVFHSKFDVEKNLDGGEGNEDNDDDVGDEEAAMGEDKKLGDDIQDTIDNISGTGATSMDTYVGPTAPAGSGGGLQVVLPCHPNVLEDSVRAEVLEENTLAKDADVITIDKHVEDNVGRHLLQEFEEESEEEKTLEAGDQVEAIPNAPSVPVVKEKKKKKKNKKKKEVWGLVLAARMSIKIPRDGKSAIEKAQELKKAKNLEILQGNKVHGFFNSFAALDNDYLARNASAVGISLGSSAASTDSNIICLKNIELGRLDKFHKDHPDMSLPQDIGLTVEHMVGPSKRIYEDD